MLFFEDKNSDCDTSAIFTIIQSAYETLHATAPEECYQVNRGEKKFGRDEGEGRKAKYKEEDKCDGADAGSTTASSASAGKEQPARRESMSNQGYSGVGAGGRGPTAQATSPRGNKPSYSDVPRAPPAAADKDKERERDPRSKAKRKEHQQSQESSSSPSMYPDASSLSTDQLREIVREFGVRALYIWVRGIVCLGEGFRIFG